MSCSRNRTTLSADFTVLFPPIGHFTQVVWKDSTELGVGMATDGNKAFVVGQYRPAGNMNMAGYFEKNVLKLGKILLQLNLIYCLSLYKHVYHVYYTR